MYKQMRTYQFYAGAFLLCFLALLISACGSVTSTSTNIPKSTATAVPTTRPTTVPTTTPTSVSVVPTTTPDTPLTVTFSCGGGKDGVSVSQGHAKVCVYTLPSSSLKIQVNFCQGKADPSSVLLKSAIANANGFYEWDWTPQPDCKGQPIWAEKVTVIALFHGQTAHNTYIGMA